MPSLFAISDLHLNYRANRDIAEALAGESPDDWLVVAGDVGHRVDEIIGFLALMRSRFARVIWTPGNHDLWHRDEPSLRGALRYDHLVEACRRIDVLTPEDPFAVWPTGVTIAPLFILYDYTQRPAGTTKDQAMAAAYAARVVCNDELLLAADPYASRQDWCADRVALTEARLAAVTGPTVLVSHWPLHPAPLRRLRHPEFSLWCGTAATADWHTRFGAVCCVHGHLHIPLTDEYDGVRHEEVSLGYPRERAQRMRPVAYGLRRILRA